MDNIEFERLDVANIDNINEIVIDDNTKYNKKELEKFIENSNNYIFIGKIKNEVVALLYGYGLKRPDGKNMFYIHSVDVIISYQGKGIGPKLIQYTLDYIKAENKYYKYFVLADVDNERAIKIYEKNAKKKEQFLFNGEV